MYSVICQAAGVLRRTKSSRLSSGTVGRGLEPAPPDVSGIQNVGNVIAAYIGLSFPIPPIVGALVWNIGIWSFQNNDGSISFLIPYQSYVNNFGNVFYYGAQQAWYYFYSQASSLYCWARKISTGQLFYAC